MLKRAFEELSQQFHKLFDSKAYLANKEQSVVTRVKESNLLESRLKTLFSYLATVMDQDLASFYTN